MADQEKDSAPPYILRERPGARRVMLRIVPDLLSISIVFAANGETWQVRYCEP